MKSLANNTKPLPFAEVRFTTSITEKVVIPALLTIVVGCVYAISVPWIYIYRWFQGTTIGNPGFLPAPVDNQTWYVIFSSIAASILLIITWNNIQFRRLRTLDKICFVVTTWFTYYLIRACLAPHFRSMHHELMLQSAFLMIFFIGAILYTSYRQLVLFAAAIAVAVIPVCIIAFFQNAGHDPLPYSTVVPGTLDQVAGKNLISSTFGHPNYMGSYLAPAFVLSIGLAVSTVGRGLKMLGWLASVLCIFAMIIGGTRGPVVAVLGGTIVFLISGGARGYFRPRSWKLVAMVAGGLVACSLILVYFGLTYNLSDRIFASKEIASRVFYWITGLRMFQHAPLFGIGAGQFDSQFWWQITRMPEVAPGGPWNFILDSTIRGVRPGYMHNDHLQILVETGVFGALLWILVWTLVVSRSIQIHKSLAELNLTSQAPINAAFIGAFAAVGIDGLFGFPFHLPCSGALFWGALGLWAGYNPRRPELPELHDLNDEPVCNDAR